jgi:hypothetical protein
MSIPGSIAIFVTVAFLLGAAFILATTYIAQKESGSKELSLFFALGRLIPANALSLVTAA